MLGTATKLKTARTITLSGAVKGSASFDGSNNITITTTQANIAVLSGSFTLKANSALEDTYEQTTYELNYPSGYSKSNCVILAFSGNVLTTEKWGAYGSSPFESSNLMTGNLPRHVTLDDKIVIGAYNPANSSKTFKYKIVLMKI